MKIVDVSQSHVVARGVGWLGWLGWSNFCYRLISQADCQDKAPYKISTQYLKAFKSYPILKFASNDIHTYDIHTTSDIRHQPLANYSPRRNIFRRGQKSVFRVSKLDLLIDFSTCLDDNKNDQENTAMLEKVVTA